MKDYFRNAVYQDRLDYIYTYSEKADMYYGREFYLKRNSNNKDFHPSEDKAQHCRDELGKYVLISKEFVYFGKEEKVISQHYMQAGFLPRRQETKHYSSKETDEKFDFAFALVNEYMCDEYYCVKNTKPSIELTPGCKGCNQK